MSSIQNNSSANQIVLGIPMLFKDKRAILDALEQKYGTNYLWTGAFFQDIQAKKYCAISIDTFEDKARHYLIDSYCSLRQEKNFEERIEEIDSCHQIVYLTSYKLGCDACVRMAKYARIFLTLGGIAVIVNSTGIICDRDRWLASYNSQDVFELYSLFVTLIEGDCYYYSSGMGNFGKADVSLDLTEDIGLANYVMNVFNYYRLTESVILKDGETFQPDLECPLYRINWRASDRSCDRDGSNDNYHGKWHLSRVRENLDITYHVN